MRLRLIQPWGRYREGEVIEPADGLANLLIQRGFAEPVIEEERIETATYPKRGKR